MKESFINMLNRRIHYFIEQFFSVKLFFLTLVTLIYYNNNQAFDWVFVALVGMLLACREGKELLAIWKGSGAS